MLQKKPLLEKREQQTDWTTKESGIKSKNKKQSLLNFQHNASLKNNALFLYLSAMYFSTSFCLCETHSRQRKVYACYKCANLKGRATHDSKLL